MAELIERLPWDSEFFGIPIARTDLNGASLDTLRAIDAEARAEGITCLYATLDPTDEATAYDAQTLGHRLVEVSLNFERPGVPFTRKPSDSKVRPATLDDLPALDPAIRTMASWSRYAADPRFGPAAARRMHDAIVERAARGVGGRALVVAYDDAGVTKPGTGAADALLCWLFDWADGGPTEAGWAAARNIPCLRWLGRWGFRACGSKYVFHRWFDEAEGWR